MAMRATTCDIPRGDFCKEVDDGWLISNDSAEWLYKASNGVYFHSPSESLWRKARGHSHLVRLDTEESCVAEKAAEVPRIIADAEHRRRYERAIVALSLGGSSGTTLLRVCFTSWHLLRENDKMFEEMQRDLLACSEVVAPRLRTSLPHAPQRSADIKFEDRRLGESAWPSLAQILGLPALWPASEERNDENTSPGDINTIREENSTGLRRLRSINMELADTILQESSSLTSVAVARHNVQPLSQRTVPALIRSKSRDLTRSKSREWLSGQFDVKPGNRLDAVAAVHLEREGSWRHHEKH